MNTVEKERRLVALLGGFSRNSGIAKSVSIKDLPLIIANLVMETMQEIEEREKIVATLVEEHKKKILHSNAM